MKRALLLGLALSGCDETRLKARPDASLPPAISAASPVTSAASPVTSAGAPVAPRTRRPPEGAASREARENAALDLLEGRARAADLPIADVDRGERFEPLLRLAMAMPVRIEIGAVSARDLYEAATRSAVGRDLMPIRLCYAAGLRNNPNLMGRVEARVVVKAAGKPHSVTNGGADVPDSAVVRCVIEALEKVTFPAPSAAEGHASVPVILFPAP